MSQAKRQFYFLDKVLNIMIETMNAELVLDELAARLKIYEQRFSQTATSQLGTLNHQSGAKAITVDRQLYELIKLGKYHSLKQASNLNIAIAPLTQLWRIGQPDARIPSAEEIQATLPLTNPEQIVLDDNQSAVFLTQPGMVLDLSSLVKGYVTDLLVSYLNSINVHAALIDFDGNITVLGPSRQVDQQWRVPVSPAMAANQGKRAMVSTTNRSFITRQIYKRALVKQQRAYSYFLDPQTGRPIETDLTSLTIISPQAIDGEIWSLRLLNQSIDHILAIVNQQPNLEAVLIDDEDDIIYSDGLTELINWQ